MAEEEPKERGQNPNGIRATAMTTPYDQTPSPLTRCCTRETRRVRGTVAHPSPHSQCSPGAQRWPWPVCCPSRDLQGERRGKSHHYQNSAQAEAPRRRGLTAHGSARWSGPLHVGVSLPLRPVHNSPPEDAFQLSSVWWGDGVSADGQLHQGQPHAPHVRLDSVVSPLQPLRLLENRQPVSEGQVEPRWQGGEGRGTGSGRGE